MLRERINEERIEDKTDENKAKVVVPKLKLDILPNYHKKSEKSLNESLLAIYN